MNNGIETMEQCCQLWKLGEKMCLLLDVVAENPACGDALEGISTAFQAMESCLSQELKERMAYLFSGAEIGPEDLRDAGTRIREELAAAIGNTLAELLDQAEYLEYADVERLFPLWEAMPHTAAVTYQWMFYLCEKIAVSAPMDAFRYSLRLLEEQPSLFGEPHPGYVFRPSENRTFERCPICGGAGTPYFRAFSYAMADFRYPHLPVKLWMKCGSCGDLYTWKYPEEYLQPSGQEGEIIPDPSRMLTAVSSISSTVLAIWSDIFHLLSAYTGGKSLLEVGVGGGELLAVALELGYRPDAVEIAPSAARRVADMLGLTVWCGDFLDYAPDRTYSIITMGDVIEHITDPERALRNAWRLLEPDGVLWLSTPNYESAFSRMMKFRDPMWMEPTHISYFSRRGLEVLAGKCGFVLREYHVSKRYNGSMELIFTKAAQGGGE